VADIVFTGYAFPATGAPSNRTMPARLNDVINVKDFGATGDGVTDDGAEIQAAIDYAYSLNTSIFRTGSPVFFPPGVYVIGTPIRLDPLGATSGPVSLQLIGSGRDATILKGTHSAGFLLNKSSPVSDYLTAITDLTIQNDSTTAGSGALYIESLVANITVANCHFIGMTGLVFSHDQYHAEISDCIARCNAALQSANSASPHPRVDTVGIYLNAGVISNCRAIGFDSGFGISQTGVMLIGSSAYRCNTGVNIGKAGNPINPSLKAGGVVSCYFDRCKTGILVDNLTGGIIAANDVVGTTGVPDPVPIRSMSWNNVNHVVTVTTAAAHHLPTGNSSLILSVSPSAWLPRSDGLVTATKTTSIQFTYPGPASDPGSFTTGTWNYALQYGIKVNACGYAGLFSNALRATVSGASFGMEIGAGTPQLNVTVAATRAPYGWAPRTQGVDGQANWKFLQCWTTDFIPPVAYMTFDTLPGQFGVWYVPVGGEEFTIIDAATQNIFGGTVTSGGSNHYKVRHNGSGWVRVG
jgi:Pectate lyase superfamily protein